MSGAVGSQPIYSESGPTARRLGCSVSLLHKYTREGIIAPLRTVGGQLLFTEEDIVALDRIRRKRAEAQRHRGAADEGLTDEVS